MKMLKEDAFSWKYRIVIIINYYELLIIDYINYDVDIFWALRQENVKQIILFYLIE